MVREGEVCCGVVKWLVSKQEDMDRETGNKKHLAFWADKKTFNGIKSHLGIRNSNFQQTKTSICSDFNINLNMLDRCWLGIEDIRIPYSISNEVLPDFAAHIYDTSTNISETWAIEAKPSGTNSVQRAYFQVISHALGVSKSYLAVPDSLEDAVNNLYHYNYGILLYNSPNQSIQEKSKQVITRANPKTMGYLTNYLRDYHFKDPTHFTGPYGLPFRISRISISGEITLALKLYYGHNTTNETDRGNKIKDLRRMGFIDKDGNVTSNAKLFFEILDKYLEKGIHSSTTPTNRKKVNFFTNTLPSIQGRRTLYEGNELGNFVSNLLHMFLSSNNSLKELIGWIKQATEESDGERPTFAHVFSIGLKRNPLLLRDMMLSPHLDTVAPTFQDPQARRGNVCMNCDYRDKRKYCFCTNINLTNQPDFQKKYDDFIGEWRKHIPYEFFTDPALQNRYIKTHTYPNGREVEILAPGFIKCLIHTDTDKTTSILRHSKILGKDVRSGIKAELCTRYDPYYLGTA